MLLHFNTKFEFYPFVAIFFSKLFLFNIILELGLENNRVDDDTKDKSDM